MKTKIKRQHHESQFYNKTEKKQKLEQIKKHKDDTRNRTANLPNLQIKHQHMPTMKIDK